MKARLGAAEGITATAHKLARIIYRLLKHGEAYLRQGLARIFHSGIEQRSGESVRRLDITQPNENATHRFLYDRL
jgi:hypothetical protein